MELKTGHTEVKPKDMPKRREGEILECAVCERATIRAYDLPEDAENAGWVYDEASPSHERFGLGWICSQCFEIRENGGA